MPLATVLVRYWHQHAIKIPSSAQAKAALAYWNEFWTTATVNELTIERQEEFIDWLKCHDFSNAYVSRVLGVGRAALNRAWKRQEITSTPFIIDEKDRSDEKEYYRMSKAQMRTLITAARDSVPHLHMFIMLSLNTMARPTAVLQLGPVQADFEFRRLDMNPPGRRRNKKGRPLVPMTGTILPMIKDGVRTFEHPLRTEKSKRANPAEKRTPTTYVNWCGKPVASVRKSFTTLVSDAGLPAAITPYSIRHTMATELRARGVPWEQIKGMLGHKMPGVTEKYAKYDPSYMSEGAKAIDAYYRELCVPPALHIVNGGSGGKMSNPLPVKGRIGAGEEDRTLDIDLGKVALYR